MIITEPYNTGNKEEWDEFVRHSKNATFLFLRDYMDYHSDRFRDSSLIFRDKNGIAGLLPANRRGNVLESHGGLTYGGILSGNDITTNTMLEIFTSLKTYCHENGINQLIYKCIPCFYHSTPSDEDLYALFRNDAVLVRREVSSLIRIPAYSLPSRKKYSYRKLLKSNMVVEESDRLEEFFELVQTRLSEKYRTNAVHSAEEMKLLKSRFPENIRFFSVICDDVMLGGALLYVNKKTVHVQYYGASDEGVL